MAWSGTVHRNNKCGDWSKQWIGVMHMTLTLTHVTLILNNLTFIDLWSRLHTSYLTTPMKFLCDSNRSKVIVSNRQIHRHYRHTDTADTQTDRNIVQTDGHTDRETRQKTGLPSPQFAGGNNSYATKLTVPFGTPLWYLLFFHNESVSFMLVVWGLEMAPGLQVVHCTSPKITCVFVAEQLYPFHRSISVFDQYLIFEHANGISVDTTC